MQGKDKIKKITDLTFVSCVAVGDIFNKQKNSLVVVTADGWCYIYEVPDNAINVNEEIEKIDEDISQASLLNYFIDRIIIIILINQVDGQVQSGETLEYSTESNKSQADKDEKPQLVCVHIQRIPPNAKVIFIKYWNLKRY